MGFRAALNLKEVYALVGVGTDCDRRRRCARRRSFAGLARRRTGRLQQQFGPEYERTLGTTDSKRDAEAELQAREEGRQRLEIRPLSQAARDRYLQSRQSVQAQFVAGRTRVRFRPAESTS